jgi:hypothetical protein
MVRPPTRIQVVSVSGNTSRWVAEKQIADSVFAWLKETN